ncbi:MAG TPA: hypothetical protein VFQ69_11010 [Rhizomicrobium sp.]|nr:hypothetical protein [Rhizomicrobium sp.]
MKLQRVKVHKILSSPLFWGGICVALINKLGDVLIALIQKS